MSWEALAFLLGLVIAAILMFGAVWFVILLTDLEADYINPIELCNSLNQWVLPEAITHSTLFAIFILNGLWFPSLINLPLLAWNINKIAKSTYHYDPMQVFRHVATYKKEGMIKIGFFLCCFFYYLYGLIIALIHESAIL